MVVTTSISYTINNPLMVSQRSRISFELVLYTDLGCMTIIWGVMFQDCVLSFINGDKSGKAFVVYKSECDVKKGSGKHYEKTYLTKYSSG